MKKRKNYEISVIDKTYSKIISDETKFYTSDTALELAFELKETEYDFESAEIVLLNVDDRSLATRPVFKVNNDFVYEIDDDITTHYGDWRGQLMLVENGEVHVSSPIKFRIENDLYCNKPLEITEVVSWVSLKRNANGLIDELKQAVLGVEGIEDTFNENETTRQNTFETNESERDKTFNNNETTRQENEDARIEAEKQREGTVAEVENRQDTVENKFDSLQQEMTDKDVISAPEIIAARGGEPTLSARLDKEHQEVTARLAQTKSDLNKGLSTKVGKGENETITKAMLTKDFRDELANGEFSFSGNTSDIADNAITTAKRTPMGEFAMLQITSRSRMVNFNFKNDELIIPPSEGGLHEVVYRNKSYSMPAEGLTISLRDKGVTVRGFITFNIISKTFQIYGTSNIKNMSEQEIMIGVYHLETETAYINAPYLINGSLPGMRLTAPTFDNITVILGGGNYPIVDNVNERLIFPPNEFDTVVYVGSKYYIDVVSPHKEKVVDLSQTTGTSAWLLLFNLETKEFIPIPYNKINDYVDTHIIFGSFRKEKGKYNFTLPCPFLVDGKLYGISGVAGTSDAVINTKDANVKAVAHRGYSLGAPENTLPAYRLAKKKGYCYVEVDIEWTSDNIPVCLHDSKIDRTSDGTGNIRDLTLEQVKSYDFGSWKSSQYAGTTIPTLEEFLLLCKKLNLHPYLESKGGITNEQAELLVKTVKKLGMGNRVTWICFSSDVLSKLLNFDNKARVGLLGSLSETLINTAFSLKNESNEVFVDVSGDTITKELAETALLNDMEIEAWTINSASSVEGLIKNGVSGITTDVLNVAEIMQGLT